MREIIYIQAGNFSNHVGTHFWNAQESYFTYDEGDDSYVDHDISFREGQTIKGEPTFCPRLLLFDRKANFGALGEGLYTSAGDNDNLTQWDGPVNEHRQPAVTKSRYQPQTDTDTDDPTKNKENRSDIRYWSDYGHIVYHPRTPQRLPDPTEYESTNGDWVLGRDAFKKYDEETDFTENCFRFFLEECDNIQGIQVMNDTTPFGSFTNSFLTAFRDEFTKLPCWTFSHLSSQIPGLFSVDDPQSIRNALNDALCLQGLNELSSIAVPLQSPSSWDGGPWLDGMYLNQRLYETSSVLATHIETATLPLRLKGSQDTLYSLSSTLTMRGNQRFAHLSGVFPLLSNARNFDERLQDFTLNTVKSSTPSQTNGCIDVSRAILLSHREEYAEWRSQWRPEPHYVEAPAVNVPTSFPRYFTAGTPPFPLSAFSTISTTSRTSILFSRYAKLADDCTKQYAYVVQQMGLEMDDIKELRDTLWRLEDEYKGDEISSGDGGEEDGE